MSIETLINEAALSFETKTRDNGEDFTCLKEDAPQWLKAAIPDIHGTDIFPDDWRYAKIEGIFDAFGGYEFSRYESEDETQDIIYEIADSLCDIYYYDLARWITAGTFHEVEAAIEQRRGLEVDLSKSVQIAQYEVIQRMAQAAIDAIKTEAL